MNIQPRIFLNNDFVHVVPHSVLHIRKTATNLFVTFSLHNKVLYSSSAGSAGVIGKERRRNNAVNVISVSFNKFVRYYIRTHEDMSVFRNIVVQVSAPVKLVRWFLQNVRRYLVDAASKYNDDVMLRKVQMQSLNNSKSSNMLEYKNKKANALDFLNVRASEGYIADWHFKCNVHVPLLSFYDAYMNSHIYRDRQRNLPGCIYLPLYAHLFVQTNSIFYNIGSFVLYSCYARNVLFFLIYSTVKLCWTRHDLKWKYQPRMNRLLAFRANIVSRTAYLSNSDTSEVMRIAYSSFTLPFFMNDVDSYIVMYSTNVCLHLLIRMFVLRACIFCSTIICKVSIACNRTLFSLIYWVTSNIVILCRYAMVCGNSIHKDNATLTHKNKININNVNSGISTNVIADLFLFRIVLFVNKSTVPFNGCRSSRRLCDK